MDRLVFFLFLAIGPFAYNRPSIGRGWKQGSGSRLDALLGTM